jgi:hypothetical protein
MQANLLTTHITKSKNLKQPVKAKRQQYSNCENFIGIHNNKC